MEYSSELLYSSFSGGSVFCKKGVLLITVYGVYGISYYQNFRSLIRANIHFLPKFVAIHFADLDVISFLQNAGVRFDLFAEMNVGLC